MTAPKRWTVTGQTPRERIDPTGNVVSGYDVAFATAAGHVGTVFVPMARYRPDLVAADVDALAVQLDAVGAITSDHLDT